MTDAQNLKAFYIVKQRLKNCCWRENVENYIIQNSFKNSGGGKVNCLQFYIIKTPGSSPVRNKSFNK